ncbi:hypothetical protein [Lysobacter gummosus]|uniref:hypothetical protein n=1 Tax=Lysobacter gummosus TaxID=262324 RepID=UPI003CCE33E4
MSYHNQCGVMIAGKAGFNTTRAGTVDEAAKNGFDLCRSEGLEGCKIYYSDCSHAKKVE